MQNFKHSIIFQIILKASFLLSRSLIHCPCQTGISVSVCSHVSLFFLRGNHDLVHLWQKLGAGKVPHLKFFSVYQSQAQSAYPLTTYKLMNKLIQLLSYHMDIKFSLVCFHLLCTSDELYCIFSKLQYILCKIFI
jgi:hypothetical protein